MTKYILKGLLPLLLLVTHTSLHSLNIAIVESQSFNGGHQMDQIWLNVATGMGHTAALVPQTILDNNAFFPVTDVLIVSSGVIPLNATRINTIQQFIQAGKPVYMQSEYDCNYTSNQGFAQIVNALGGSFNWISTTPGTLQPMNVLGTFATTNQPVTPLSYYWYSCAGNAGCNVFAFLEYGAQYHGFFFCPPNQAYGRIITTTDQDWVNQSTSVLLLENIITHLITPSLCQANNQVSVDLGNDTTICTGGSLLLNATTANATYLWNNGTTQPTLNVNSSGTYWVEINVNGCTARDTIVINLGNLNNVNLGPDTLLCTAQTLMLTAGPPGGSYVWQNGSTGNTFNVNQPGTYWVTVSSGQCIDQDTIVVNYQNVQPANLGPDQVLCAGNTTTLNATQPGAGSYTWQDGSTNPQFTASQTGNYWVEIDYGSCLSVDTVHIFVVPLPAGNFLTDLQLCIGSPALLQATQGMSGYLWSTGETTASITVNTSGNYWAVVTDANNCTNSDTATVSFVPGPIVDLGDDSRICEDSTRVLQPLIIDPALQYLWSTGETTPQISINSPGEYYVQGTGNCGSSSDTIEIFPMNCVCYLYLPNTFTANTDGKNDFFKPGFYCDLAKYELKIYDRWGEMLFFSDNPYKGWDGNIVGTGKPAPIGVYVYAVKYSSTIVGFDEVTQRGHVNLIR